LHSDSYKNLKIKTDQQRRTSSSTMRVFKVDSKYDAELKIFKTDSRWDADVAVTTVDSQWDDATELLWYHVPSKFDEPSLKIFFVDSPYGKYISLQHMLY
jgi:hypothetical protein